MKKIIMLMIVSLFLVGCASRSELKKVKKEVAEIKRRLAIDIWYPDNPENTYEERMHRVEDFSHEPGV